MDNDIDLSVAMDAANRKIVELNIKLSKEDTEENQIELNKWITIKKEIAKGNVELIKRVINNDI